MSGEERRKALASFMKSNKQRRLTLALREGWSTADDYQAYLENLTDDAERTIESTTADKPTVHVIDVVDCSSSMYYGRKIDAATKGVNDGIEDMKKNTEVNFKYSLLTFSYAHDVTFRTLRTPINDVNYLSFIANGNTALYDAVGKAIESFRENAEKGDKVLINVYTDGEENCSQNYTKKSIGKLIEDMSNLITVTFIGTEADTRNVVRDMNIHVSNTLSYDGTAEGLSKSISSTISARNTYATNVSQGNDVRTGFYKEVVNK